MSALMIQRLLAVIFLGLGGWCVVTPGVVERLVLRPEYVTGSATHLLLLGCFGAQAVLCGTVIAFSRFTPITFLVFGLVGSIPFFAFNFYFYFIEQLFTNWMLLDFVGNIGILACGLAGYCAAKRESAAIGGLT